MCSAMCRSRVDGDHGGSQARPYAATAQSVPAATIQLVEVGRKDGNRKE